jgi:site-specific recombinase XerD
MKTFAEHLEEFLAWSRVSNNSPDTLNMLDHGGRQLLAWLEQQYSLTQADRLTSQHLEAWGRHVSSRTTRNGLPLKPHSIAKQFSTDRAFLRWLEREGLVPPGMHLAIPNIKVPKLLPTSVLAHRQVIRVLGKVDLSSPEGIQLRAMLEVMYGAGLRVRELLSLDTNSIDLDTGLVRVMGKGSEERIVPVGQTALAGVISFLVAVRSMLLRGTETAALWLDRSGQRMPKHTFRRLLIALSSGIKLPVHVTPYTFRRSFATELIIHGANPYAVALLLGHKNMDSIDHYVKLAATELKKVHRRYHPRERDRK